MKQRFTSKQTSINSTKAPAVYSMKRAVDVMTGKTGAPLIIWTKPPPLSRVGMLPGLVV